MKNLFYALLTLTLLGCNHEGGTIPTNHTTTSSPVSPIEPINSPTSGMPIPRADEPASGGDPIVADFESRVDSIYAWVKMFDLNQTLLTQSKESIKLESTTEKLFIDGVEKGAINYPRSRRIQVSVNYWKALKENFLKDVLVLHELLGLAEMEDKNYYVSLSMMMEIYQRWYNRSFNMVCAITSTKVVQLKFDKMVPHEPTRTFNVLSVFEVNQSFTEKLINAKLLTEAFITELSQYPKVVVNDKLGCLHTVTNDFTGMTCEGENHDTFFSVKDFIRLENGNKVPRLHLSMSSDKLVPIFADENVSKELPFESCVK